MNKIKSAMAALALGGAFAAATTTAVNAQYRDFTKADECLHYAIDSRVESAKLDGASEIFIDDADFAAMKNQCEKAAGVPALYFAERKNIRMLVPPPREYAPH